MTAEGGGNGEGNENGGGALPPTELQALEARWRKRADDLAFDELPRVRTVAEKWTQTISALAGLSTIVALLQATEATEKLPEITRGILFAILLAAMVAAVAAIYNGTRAAHGEPKGAGPQDGAREAVLTDWTTIRVHYKNEAKKAAGQLRTSQQLALLATALIVAALLVFWFAPTESAAKTTTVLAVQSSGNVICGSLERVAGEANLRVKPSKEEQAQTLTDITSLSVVENCPEPPKPTGTP